MLWSEDTDEPLQFDVAALKRISAERLERRECVSITKLAEGSYNKVFLLTMDDDFECIARLALPCYPRFKTESEVATMKFLAEKTSIPVPKVYAWDSDANNAVGAEYILMERIPGITLSTIWNMLSLDEKKRIASQVVDIELQLFSTSLDQIGSLYMDHKDHTYYVGPIVIDPFFEGGRASMDLDRGPWKTTRDFLNALIQNETDYLSTHATKLNDEQVQSSLQLCSKFKEVAHLFCPDNPSLERVSLRHSDLHMSNIMVELSFDEKIEWRISGIIDWEVSVTYPAWACAKVPRAFELGAEDEANGDSSQTDQKEFQELSEEAEILMYYKSEAGKRNEAFKAAMEEGRRCRIFRDKIILGRHDPSTICRWIQNIDGDGNSLHSVVEGSDSVVEKTND